MKNILYIALAALLAALALAAMFASESEAEPLSDGTGIDRAPRGKGIPQDISFRSTEPFHGGVTGLAWQPADQSGTRTGILPDVKVLSPK